MGHDDQYVEGSPNQADSKIFVAERVLGTPKVQKFEVFLRKR